MQGVNWNLDADRKTVTLTLPTTPPSQMTFTLEQVDAFLVNMGQMRAMMEPPVAADMQPGQQVEAIPDPRWYVEKAQLATDGSVLNIRDPRYGWLHYFIPRDTALHLGCLLVHQAYAPPAAAPEATVPVPPQGTKH